VNLTLRSTAPRRPFKGLAAFTSMLTLSGSLLLVAGAAAASAAAANPHNGTVKLDGKSVDTDDPANEPHLNSCSIPVEWFDFDNAAFTSVVSFVEKGGPGNNNPVPIATQVPPGSIAFTGASTNQLNHTVTFTLNTAGAQSYNTAQGAFHVKMDVSVTRVSNGATAYNKFKTFWVPPCQRTATTQTPTLSQSVCANGAPTTPTYTVPNTPGVIYKVGNTTVSGVQTAAAGTTVTVQAIGAPGVVLTGQTSFPLVFAAAPNCTTNGNTPTSPDLKVVKTGPTQAVRPGDQVSYSLVVSNTGTAGTSSVTVSDSLPAGLTLVSAAGTGFICSGGPNVVCTYSGTLAAGASASIALVTTLASTYTGATVANTAVVTPTDATPSDNTSTATTDVVIDDLAVSKAGPATVRPGDELVYTLIVTNVKGSTATAFTVTDTLAAGLTFSSASGTGFTCVNAGQLITCTFAGSLPVGQTATISVRALLDSAFTSATIANTAVVNPGRPDSDSTNNSSTTAAEVVPLPISGGGGGGATATQPSQAPGGLGGGSGTVAGGAALPFTGAAAASLLETGVTLLLLGLLLALAARRRGDVAR
jgi:uncharacterized repeat protein (TIGR01451 family)